MSYSDIEGIMVDENVIVLEPQQVETLLNTININKGVLGN